MPEPEPLLPAAASEPVAAAAGPAAAVLGEPVGPPPAEAPVAEPAVAAAASAEGPRRWNLWELERLTRAVAGADLVRDEERSYLLVYLRDFASPDGLLPEDFDLLVRESFGDLLAAPSAV